MDTFGYVILPFLIMLAVIAVAIILYVGQYKTAPVWIQKTAFRINLLGKLSHVLGKWSLYLLVLLGIIFLMSLILPDLLDETPIWLAPESTFGYAEKYNVPESKVHVDPKPHDCEWGKAPIGNKYCHFEKTVSAVRDSQGKVMAVYVGWEKKED